MPASSASGVGREGVAGGGVHCVPAMARGVTREWLAVARAKEHVALGIPLCCNINF
jgi:hypothetical protein